MTASKRADEERILTLHPQGKNGVNITRDKYDAIRGALLKTIPKNEKGIALGSLTKAITPFLPEHLFPEGRSVTWYIMAVKQDLEARRIIEQVPGQKPQHLRQR